MHYIKVKKISKYIIAEIPSDYSNEKISDKEAIDV